MGTVTRHFWGGAVGHAKRKVYGHNIGEAMASRGLLAELRETGEVTGGPPPFGKKDRSLFLQRLDEAVYAGRRHRP